MPNDTLAPILLRPSEAATVLGIGRSKLYELLAAGSIESIKLGNCRRIPRECLDAFIAEARSQQTS